jgi:hypothetical protein
MLNPQMKGWGSYEFMRRKAQELKQRREPEPLKTHWAPGSLEWQAERGSYGRGHGWLVSERTAFRIVVSQARIPTWMGLPSRNRSLLSSEKGGTYASIPRRKAKTAASQRLPGRIKDGLLIMCFKSIEISGEEAPSGWPLRRIFERL